jgi:hypothetical protein
MKTYWKMRNGNLIDVDEMDIYHLRNALKIIIRNSQTAKKPAPSKFELKGEMSQLFNDDHSMLNDDCSE